jgi:hypothetical protein
MFKTSFTAKGCSITVETISAFDIGDDISCPVGLDVLSATTLSCTDMAISLHATDGANIAQCHIVRVPSSYKENSAIGPYYRMSDVMQSAGTPELSLVCDELHLENAHPQTYASKQLRCSDLYHVEGIQVAPKFQDKGIEEWMLSNINHIIRRVVHENVPVCTIIQPTGYTPEELSDAGWSPVQPGSSVWYRI